MLIALLTSAALLLPAHDESDPFFKWFREMRTPSGDSCCGVADGRYTSHRGAPDGGYEVLIEGQWVPVPPRLVIRTPNPTGQDAVWYQKHGAQITIYCFVPGTES